jgi:hypothetical protein
MKTVSLRISAALVLLALVGGCSTPIMQDPARVGPFFRPVNHTGEASITGIRRVVLMPLFAGEVAPAESALALDAVLASALQAEQRFEVVVLTREECRQLFRATELSSTSALPHDFLAVLRRQFAADAMMFVDLTVFRGYRPLGIGFRAKLASLDGGRLIWSFDNIYSTLDPTVVNGARHHFLRTASEVPADLSVGVLHSPTQFGAYAASSMFSTLPPTFPPLAPQAAAPKAAR